MQTAIQRLDLGVGEARKIRGRPSGHHTELAISHADGLLRLALAVQTDSPAAAPLRAQLSKELQGLGAVAAPAADVSRTAAQETKSAH